MAGNREGHAKARATMIAEHFNGDENAYLEWKREMGRKGGRNGTGHTFAHGKFSPVEAGKIGGRNRKGYRKNEKFRIPETKPKKFMLWGR